MRPDQYKKKHQNPRGDDKLRRKIAVEAARRMLGVLRGEAGTSPDRLREATEAEFYAAKRKAAAVLGQSVRPGDLPSDSEVREQVLALIRSGVEAGEVVDDEPEVEPAEGPARLADHLDRFAVYRLRLAPLEAVKQDPRTHPEGDALYHSLQVFERARDARPFDEEFLLAALLHDVGRAIDPQDPPRAAVEALRGAVPDRTLALIARHDDPTAGRDRPKDRGPAPDADTRDDLALLRELDGLGRVPGAAVGTVEEALAYLRGLEREAYLDLP